MATPLPEHLVDEVRSRVDILDIAGDATTLRKVGPRWVGLCPLHSEKTPSFTINEELNVFYCFGCKEGGDAIGLYERLTGADFKEAILELAADLGLSPAPSAERNPLETACERFCAFLEASPDAQHYLTRRGITRPVWRRYEVGFAPASGTGLWQALRNQFPVDELIGANLVVQRDGVIRDCLADRLVFPVRRPGGSLSGFCARSLKANVKAKYLNTHDLPKSRLLLGFRQARRQRSSGVTLVEGVFDVLALATAQRVGVAVLGSEVSPQQCELLARLTKSVTIAFDGDEAGRSAVAKALPLLLKAGLDVKAATLPADTDPSSLHADGRLLQILDSSGDAIEAALDAAGRLNAPREQAAAVKAVIRAVRAIPDSLSRLGYERMVSQRFNLARLPTEAPQRTRYKSRVSQQERRVLTHLLLTDWNLEPDSLPSPSIFSSPTFRRAYQELLILKKEGPRPVPVVRLLDRLAPAASDDVVQLLLDPDFLTDSPQELINGLKRLVRARWLRQNENSSH